MLATLLRLALLAPAERGTPGPVPDPSAPWWLNGAPLQNVTGDLPTEADVVIIGAGITGASIARHTAMLEPHRAASTLVLDARGAAGGATGRNGAMAAPMDCYDFESITARDGLSEALAERAMQFDTLSLQREYIEASGIEADLRLGGYFVGWLSQQDVGRGEAAHAFCELHREQCADPYCGLNEALNAEEARERTRSPRMEGALFQPSGGSVWSARIAFGLLEEAIAAGVTLRTQTRVLAVEPAGATQAEEGGDADGGGRYGQWSVRTDKGTVRARHVVYATNAYSSTLLPEFRGVINPYRNQVVVTTPAPALSDAMFWLSSPSAGSSYAYIVQRADGRLVIGANAAPGDHLDDSVASISEQVTERMLAELRETWPALADVEAEQVHMGVTLWTADGFPWVGPLPSQPGNFIAAGFTEGNVQCFSSGHAIAQMLAGNDHPAPFNRRYLPSAREGYWAAPRNSSAPPRR